MIKRAERESILKELARYPSQNYVPPDSTGSLAAWELCRLWMENCLQNHDICKTIHPGVWWPTRLLYIGDLGDGYLGNQDLSHHRVKLHLTQHQQPEGFYTTLSHCWGKTEEMLKLTDMNHKYRVENGFSFAEIPKTFQDAVRLSRFLGAGYIWIDSLCIIQGNKEDWLRESKTMANVYRYSRCNIAATASQGPTEGCFYDRKLALVSPCEITLHSQEAHHDLPPGKKGIEEASTREYLIFDPFLWEYNVEEAPLNKRAWVMQERTLAPRVTRGGIPI